MAHRQEKKAQDIIVRDQRSTREKLLLFKRFFSGLDHVYGTYDPRMGRSWQIKAPVTDDVLLAHLKGQRPYGAYLLTGDRTRAIAADCDDDNPELPIQFVTRANHYGFQAYIERSKVKGFHCWCFFEEKGVPAWKARRVAQHILAEMEAACVEVFPKHDMLPSDGTSYGNFINATLFGALVLQGRTVFLDTRNGLELCPNQWEFLDNIQPVAESVLDDVIEINGLGQPDCPQNTQTGAESLGRFQAAGGLPPCIQAILRNGVTENQRVACFRLAVHLRRIGMPYELVVAALREWAGKNRPMQGKRIITLVEIMAQTASAFLKEYRGCGCEEPALAPYCDPACPVREEK